MKKFVFLLFLITFFYIELIAQSTVRGVVYEDINKNRVFDSDENGIHGVPVSNGREVVLTNEDGKYELPVGNDDIIFVIKPSDYQVHISNNNLPEFYYIHKPLGSPQLEYQGVPPTGDLPSSVDFPLYAIENEKDDFEVLLFGDPQVYNNTELKYFDDIIISELENNERALFGISLGDLVGNNPDLFMPYVEKIKKIGKPWYNAIGNHDLNLDAQTYEASDESYENAFGPSTYSFNYGKVHFIILHNILFPDPRDGRGYWGGFTSNQISFIENNLKFVPQDHLIVLAFHIPIWEEFTPYDIFRDEDRDKLFTLLKDFPHTLSFSGHTHYQKNKYISTKVDNVHHHVVLGTASGSWYRGKLDENDLPVSTMKDGTPQGYAYLNITGNKYELKYKATGFPDEYQMRIYSPKIVNHKESHQSSIFVNFFTGNEYDELMFRIGNNDWHKMDYTIDYDPWYLHLIHEWDFTEKLLSGRRPPEPRECHHLWKANLPSNLPVGEHTIEVKAINRNGTSFYSTKTIESR